ncbi:hypothetical protein F2Q70_00004780 [Brassica cretica]|uniref:Uncharacterized protein n=1 Tax=Brassica cretica TaxID=69181 RepID=A0A8S9IVH5_BRACR|nr:hypothetical protein F2Q70_00004780 [Brassica cretica]
MATDNPQTHIDGDINDNENVGTTPVVNVSVVNANANTAAFEEMFTAFKKKLEDHEKLIVLSPNRPGSTQDNPTGEYPGEKTYALTRKNSENLPRRAGNGGVRGRTS